LICGALLPLQASSANYLESTLGTVSNWNEQVFHYLWMYPSILSTDFSDQTLDYYSTTTISGIVEQAISEATFEPLCVSINGTNIYWTSDIYIEHLQGLASYLYYSNRKPKRNNTYPYESNYPDIVAVGTNVYDYYSTPTNIPCPVEDVAYNNPDYFKWYDVRLYIDGVDTNITVPYLYVDTGINTDLALTEYAYPSVGFPFTKYANYAQEGVFANYQTNDNVGLVIIQTNFPKVHLDYSDRINATLPSSGYLATMPAVSSYKAGIGKSYLLPDITNSITVSRPFYKLTRVVDHDPAPERDLSAEVYLKYGTKYNEDIVLEQYETLKYYVADSTPSSMMIYSNIYNVFSNACDLTDTAYAKDFAAVQYPLYVQFRGYAWTNVDEISNELIQRAYDEALTNFETNSYALFRVGTYFDSISVVGPAVSSPDYAYVRIYGQIPLRQLVILQTSNYLNIYTNIYKETGFEVNIYSDSWLTEGASPDPDPEYTNVYHNWDEPSNMDSNIYFNSTYNITGLDFRGIVFTNDFDVEFPAPPNDDWISWIKVLSNPTENVNTAAGYNWTSHLENVYPYLTRKNK